MATNYTLTAPSTGTIGTALSLTISPSTTPEPNIYFTIMWSCGSDIGGRPRYSGTVAERSRNTSFTFTPPANIVNAAPNTSSIQVLFTLSVYYGQTSMYTAGARTMVTIPQSFGPSISNATAYDGYEDISNQFGAFVQGQSIIVEECDATAQYTQYGAGIASCKASISIDDGVPVVYDLANVPNTTKYRFSGLVPQDSGTATIIFTVVDTRGFTASSTITREILSYTSPHIYQLKAERCLEDHTPNDSGTFVKITASWSVDQVLKSSTPKNTKSIALQWLNNDTWENFSDISITDWALTEAIYYPSQQFSQDYAYEIRILITDFFTSYAAREVSLPTSFTLVNFHKDGRGLAFGGVAEDPDRFDCFMKSRFRDVTDVHKVNHLNIDPSKVSLATIGEFQNGNEYWIALQNAATAIESILLKITPKNPLDLQNGAYFRFTDRPKVNQTDVALLPDIPYNVAQVIEEGSSGIWRYRKWSNGDVELWGQYSYSSLACNIPFGALYRTANITVDNFPFPIVDARIWADSFGVDVAYTNSGCFVLAGSIPSTTAPPPYWLVNPVETTTLTGGLILYVKGRIDPIAQIDAPSIALVEDHLLEITADDVRTETFDIYINGFRHTNISV